MSADKSELLSDYFTEEEMARELRVTRRTLHSWRRDKRGPPITPIGRKIFYAKASALKWMRSREHAVA